MRTPRQKLRDSGLVMWRNKRLDKMSDEECVICLREISETTGVLYV